MSGNEDSEGEPFTIAWNLEKSRDNIIRNLFLYQGL
jgi:hypothetical protein